MWCGSLYRQIRNRRVRVRRYMEFPHNPPKTVLWFELFFPQKKSPPTRGYNKIKEPVNTRFVNTSFKSTLTKSGCPDIRADRPNLFSFFVISSCQNCDITWAQRNLGCWVHGWEVCSSTFHPRGDMWLAHNSSKPFFINLVSVFLKINFFLNCDIT